MQKRVPNRVVELLSQPNKPSALSTSALQLRKFFTFYYHTSGREFPWRATGIEPFHVLIAELLLVQTKAADVAQVWPVLIKSYPSPFSIAEAPLRSLVRILRPLGLQRQRARALKALSHALVLRYGSRVPQGIEELLSLPHVGLYVASAVRAFAFGQRTAIVDANVLRVLGRVVGKDFGKDTRRSAGAWELAWSILPRRSNAQQHHFGLLDFAAQVCGKKPQCNACGLLNMCAHGRSAL